MNTDLEKSERSIAIKRTCFCTINHKFPCWRYLKGFLAWPLHGFYPPWIPCHIQQHINNSNIYFQPKYVNNNSPSQLHMRSSSPAYTSTFIPSSRRSGIPTSRFFIQSSIIANRTSKLHKAYPKSSLTPKALFTFCMFSNLSTFVKL